MIFVGSSTNAFNFQPVISAARQAGVKGLSWEFAICDDGPNLKFLTMKTAGLKTFFFQVGLIERRLTPLLIYQLLHWIHIKMIKVLMGVHRTRL